jgi:hypothetical protein
MCGEDPQCLGELVDVRGVLISRIGVGKLLGWEIVYRAKRVVRDGQRLKTWGLQESEITYGVGFLVPIQMVRLGVSVSDARGCAGAIYGNTICAEGPSWIHTADSGGSPSQYAYAEP